ncbi:hypothetical protein ACSBR1_009897 [Camellia fascicularis]
MEENKATEANGDCFDFISRLSGTGRDFLVRNTGEKVKINTLEGKKLGLYFSGSWCRPCQQFTPNLVEVYNELSSIRDFEIILVSADIYIEAFDRYFAKMPWLAIPFSDSECLKNLQELFAVIDNGIPYLVILDEKGKVLTDKGVEIILDFGAEGYPFTLERIKEMKEKEEEAKKNQSLKYLLVTPSRHFVISNDERKVPVSDIEGKMVGLYFYHPSHDPCLEFNPKLVEVYNKLKEMGERFEIVMVCLEDKDKESFNLSLRTMPWFALPFNDNSFLKLVLQFHIKSLPTLVIIGPDGKTLHSNVAEAIQEYGIQAYPFTPEKFAELEEIEKAKNAAQTLESILVSENRDFVIAKDGTKVPVSDLVGKNIFLYFSAHWCPGCRNFLPKIIEAYQEIKAKDNLFEVIFISYDRDEASFQAFFSRMSWLAIPFGDKRRESLTRKFKVSGIPMVVAIGRTGKTVTTEVTDLIEAYGGHAYSLIFQDENKDEEDVEKSVQKDEKELEKKVNEDEKGLEKTVNEDGTMMNTLLRKFLSLIQTIVEFFQKFGFLS